MELNILDGVQNNKHTNKQTKDKQHPLGKVIKDPEVQQIQREGEPFSCYEYRSQ